MFLLLLLLLGGGGGGSFRSEEEVGFSIVSIHLVEGVHLERVKRREGGREVP
jgi:hypothetical protein